MATKKQLKKKPVSLKKILFISYNVVLAMSIILLCFAVWSQSKTIDSLGMQNFNVMVGTINSNQHNPLSIDAPSSKAYVPEASLRFDYTNLASTVRYQSFLNDEESVGNQQASIGFIENYQMTDLAYSVENACTNPYFITINEEVSDGYVAESSKTLADGRKVTFSQSTSGSCSGYVNGLSGKALLDFLKTAKSY